MIKIRLLYLAYRHVQLRPDTCLALATCAVILMTGLYAHVRLDSIETKQLVVACVGAVITLLQFLLAWCSPSVFDGKGWGVLLMEALQEHRGATPAGRAHPSRRALIQELTEQGIHPGQLAR